MERKTDREVMLEIFKRAGVNVVYEQDDYIERILQNSQTLARINRALHEPFIPD